VTQGSLFETRPSLRALQRAAPHAPTPRAVFVGLGLSSGRELTRALPIDALGMLLSAEHARRAARADSLLVLLADAHAVCNGLPAAQVAACVREHERVLRRVLKRLGWSHARLVRASDLHARDEYRRLHERIRRRAPAGTHAYVTREVADIEYYARDSGGLLKLGWALHAGEQPERDERSFDRRFEQWVGHHVRFAYCKAGRALDDRGKKAVPYFDRNPRRRVCLSPDERVEQKLSSAHVSVCTLRGVRRHLKAITRSYRELVRPLCGTLEEQVQAMLDDLLASPERPIRALPRRREQP
jgi:hypothetical protein